MTKREAKRWAWRHAAHVVQTAVDGGWPFDGGPERFSDPQSGELTPEGERIDGALREVVDSMFRSGGA